jgi:L-amino acid N-acyltransferase YncA
VTSDLILRLCEERDMPAITSIYGHAVVHGVATFELESPNVEEMTRRRAAIVAAGYPYLAAEVGGEIVGYAYGSSYRPRPAYGSTIENSVYVREDCRGRGIGEALLRRLIEAATLRGFREMIAVIGDSANVASIKLHERLGFEHVGTMRSVGWKHERWLDTVLMQLSLGLSDRSAP